MNNENQNNDNKSESIDFFMPTKSELEMALDYVDYLLEITDDSHEDEEYDFYE